MDILPETRLRLISAETCLFSQQRIHIWSALGVCSIIFMAFYGLRCDSHCVTLPVPVNQSINQSIIYLNQAKAHKNKTGQTG